MKKILIIDESPVIRETLALILGREYVVLQRPLEKDGLSLGDGDSDVHLLIVGVTPAMETAGLLNWALQAPCSVLYLVDSKSAVTAVEEGDDVACLSKPFNPYELREKVRRLVAGRASPPRPRGHLAEKMRAELGQVLGFPYLSPSVAELARRFAATRLPILITGETGCGLGRIARAVHAVNDNAGPCLSLNAAEVSEASLAQKSLELSRHRRGPNPLITLILENLERLSASAQAGLANFLEEEEAEDAKLRLLTTARADLLERVYQGDFLEALYYRLATLALRLPPLRERTDELGAIAGWFARCYGERLGLGGVTLAPDAVERLSNYLWFGNLHEMEAVIARTLAAHGKTRIEASDLLMDFWEAGQAAVPADRSEADRAETAQPAGREPEERSHAGSDVFPALSGSANGKSAELKVLIHELAHELKNPMVTIKTFAQLLGERYQDETFRARFQDIVDGDIERIDDLLEVMIEFANFSQPRLGKIPLQNQVRSVLAEVAAAYSKRQAEIRWKEERGLRDIVVDEAQLRYALKNVLLAILYQAKSGSEIEIDLERQGSLNISYVREGGRISPITHYFDLSSGNAGERVLPLRILLAKQLVERNGGEMVIDQLAGQKDILRMEFPIA